VREWDARTGEELLTLKTHRSPVNSVVYSPDGRWLASAGYDRTVKVWNAHTGQERLTLTGHTDAVWGVAFSPDGQRLASTSYDHKMKVWEAGTLTQSGGIPG
jgi:WD40 repeat protein